MNTFLKSTLCIFLTSIAVAAGAQEQPVTAELNEQGLAAFAAGRYPEAAEIFGRAYALDPRPGLLKNRAVALYKSDNCDDAVGAGSQFLKLESTIDADRLEVQTLLGACQLRFVEESIESGRLAEAEQVVDRVAEYEVEGALDDRVALSRSRIAQARDARAAAERGPETVSEVRVEPAPIEFRAAPAPAKRTWAWGLVAVGGTVVAATAIYHVYNVVIIQDEFRRVRAENDENQRPRFDALDERLRFANVALPVGYALGALLSGAGVALAIAPTSDGAAVAVAVSF